MSDTPPPEPGTVADNRDCSASASAGETTPLTLAHVEKVVGDFRTWLLTLTDPPPAPERLPPVVDLSTVVAQFTALRHDVNLQTRAVRAATEQNAEFIAKLPDPDAESPPDAKPVLKALIDIADALLTAHKQVSRAMDAVEPLANELDTPPEVPPPPGFFARLFGAKPAPVSTHPAAATKLAPLLAGLADGYALSLRRVENLLPQYGFEAIECVGETFDPEFMEVVEVVAGNGTESGVVVEEVRRGYLLDGEIHRFAQVKVAR